MTVNGSRAKAGANTEAVAPANLARPSSNVRDTVVMSATSPTPFYLGPRTSVIRFTGSHDAGAADRSHAKSRFPSPACIIQPSRIVAQRLHKIRISGDAH